MFGRAHSDRAANWALDALLERDTTPIGDLPLCRALLINDANYPWLLLVPRRDATVESRRDPARFLWGDTGALPGLTDEDDHFPLARLPVVYAARRYGDKNTGPGIVTAAPTVPGPLPVLAAAGSATLRTAPCGYAVATPGSLAVPGC